MRLTHWGIAAALVLNEVVTRGGSLAHVSTGWVVLALLLLRLIWGWLGPTEARFSAFPPDPAAAFGHLRTLMAGDRPGHSPSHNPAGALMVYAFWGALAIVTVTGLLMTGGATPMQVAAEQAEVASDEASALIRADGESATSAMGKAAKEVHEGAANLLLVLAALHVAGVFVEGRRMRYDFVAPMLFGRKDKRRK